VTDMYSLLEQPYSFNLGNTITLTREDGTNAKTLVQTNGCSANGQGMLGLAFSVNETFDPAGADFRSLILAEASFGVGGGRHTALFDVRNGTQISVPADSLSVRVWQQEVGPFSPLTATVAGSIAGITRPSRHNVTRSFPRVQLNAAVAQTFGVPPFADRFFVAVNAISAFAPGSGTVLVRGANSSVGYSNGQVSQAYPLEDAIRAAATGGIVLPGAARELLIFGPNAVSGAPVFTLSL
jgi:hypothetical protein